MAAAATLLSEKWTESAYLPALESFEANEHCAQEAVARLLQAFHLLQAGGPGLSGGDLTAHYTLITSNLSIT